MKLKHLWTALALALGMGLAASMANATAVRLETASLSLAQGSFFDVRIVADIDLEAHAGWPGFVAAWRIGIVTHAG